MRGLCSCVLKLECIGDDFNFVLRSFGMRPKPQPWVARIIGLDPKYEVAREFQRGQKDYAEANRVGSRGVYLFFFLDRPGIYEVFERVTRNKSRRYFGLLENGRDNLREITKEEVLCALKEC